MNIGRVAVLALVAVAVLLLVPSEIRRESEPAVLEERRIQTAEVEYFSRYRRFGGLSELGSDGAGLLTDDLAEGRSQGFRFIVRLTPLGYTIQAVPTEQGASRFRSFFSDQTLKFRESYGSDPATESSRELR